MSAIHGATSRGAVTPLRHTDSSTWVDGLPIQQYSDSGSKMARFQPDTPMPNCSAGSADNSARHTSHDSSRVVGTTKVLVNRQTTHAAPTTPQTVPTPARSQAATMPAVSPQDPCRASDSPHKASHTSRRPDISKNPSSARDNVASNNSPPNPRSRTSHQPGQSSKPSHANARPNDWEMPATATASIAGHGDHHHVINRPQVTATARSGQNAPHTQHRATSVG
jgi:hypothetical protein